MKKSVTIATILASLFSITAASASTTTKFVSFSSTLAQNEHSLSYHHVYQLRSDDVFSIPVFSTNLGTLNFLTVGIEFSQFSNIILSQQPNNQQNISLSYQEFNNFSTISNFVPVDKTNILIFPAYATTITYVLPESYHGTLVYAATDIPATIELDSLTHIFSTTNSVPADLGVVLNSGGKGTFSFTYDYTPLDSPTPPGTGGAPSVPEPASWAMMILGFTVLGATLRAPRRLAVRFS